MALPLRALTLWQPWAWLVASGHKPIENRPPGFAHKNFRGEFWIHAAVESARSIGAWPEAIRLSKEILGENFQLPHAGELEYGVIIGRAVITGSIPPRGQMFHKPNVPWHFPDQYGLILEKAALLKTAVPCRGFQGFWPVPEPVLAELAKEKAQLSLGGLG